jgi:glycerol-3-phosphate dehydrogenase
MLYSTYWFYGGGNFMHLKKDVAIIGGGICGAAIARELSRYDISVVLLDKELDIAMGATKANSGILHAGFDAETGSLKANLNVRGNKLYYDLADELKIDARKTGSLVAAATDDEFLVLEELLARGKANGVLGLTLLTGDEVLKMEPNLAKNVRGALFAPSAGVVSPYEAALAFFNNAVINGVEFMNDTFVEEIVPAAETMLIKTSRGLIIETNYIINAAGVNSDYIAGLIDDEDFLITPQKGEYILFDKSVSQIVKMPVFPVSSAFTKGILVSPTVHGNIFIGPNSEFIEDKGNIETSANGMEEIINGGQKLVPSLPLGGVITQFSGVRATSGKDFIIRPSNVCRQMIHVAGINSPGLSSAPAIALMVLDILREQGLSLSLKKTFNPLNPPEVLFKDCTRAEQEMMIKKNPLFGRVICRCELVTEGDILKAIHAPCGARTLDGVKRRTRAGMGRCQGGFCTPKIVKILARELNLSVNEIQKDVKGSYLFFGRQA